MDKKIGKLSIFSILAVFSLFAKDSQSLSLRITDAQGHSLQNAGVGVPFIVSIEQMSDRSQEPSNPRLTLPPDLVSRFNGTSTSTRILNGHTVSKIGYQYQVVASKEGTYSIGPATVHTQDGQNINSNVVTLSVSADQKSIGATQSKQAHLELSVSNAEPFVGESITFYLRFYFVDEGIHLDQVQEPVFKECRATKLTGPVSGTGKFYGSVCNYLEWKATLYPEHDGRLIIPAVAAQCTLPMQVAHSRMGDMFSLINGMFGGGKSEHIHSNAVVLNVQPLPENAEGVTAIGRFTSFNAKVEQEKAETGEGIIFTLELVGEGNVMMIGHPHLDLPEGLKYYESNAKENLLTDQITKKDFQYVIQAVTAGDYSIPAQTFTFFDTKTKSYKTLTSRPVKITVIGESKKSTVVSEVVDKQTVDVASTKDGGELETTFSTTKSYRKRINWPLFGWIIALIVLPACLVIGFKQFRNYQEKRMPKTVYKKAFSTARSRIKEIKKAKKSSELYTIFMDLFAARLKIPRAELSETRIEQALKNAGFSDAQILEWRQFFSKTMAVTFSALPHEGDLYEEAHQWLTAIEVIL